MNRYKSFSLILLILTLILTATVNAYAQNYTGTIEDLVLTKKDLNAMWMVRTGLIIESVDEYSELKKGVKEYDEMIDSSMVKLKEGGIKAAGNITYNKKTIKGNETYDVKIRVFADQEKLDQLWKKYTQSKDDSVTITSLTSIKAANYAVKYTRYETLPAVISFKRANVMVKITTLSPETDIEKTSASKLANMMDAILVKKIK